MRGGRPGGYTARPRSWSTPARPSTSTITASSSMVAIASSGSGAGSLSTPRMSACDPSSSPASVGRPKRTTPPRSPRSSPLPSTHRWRGAPCPSSPSSRRSGGRTTERRMGLLYPDNVTSSADSAHNGTAPPALAAEAAAGAPSVDPSRKNPPAAERGGPGRQAAPRWQVSRGRQRETEGGLLGARPRRALHQELARRPDLPRLGRSLHDGAVVPEGPAPVPPLPAHAPPLRARVQRRERKQHM